MHAPREVEIKFLIQDLKRLELRLSQAGFHCTTPATHEINTLYDSQTLSLRRKGQLLRLRHYGERWILTHKSRAAVGRHKSRIELETQIDDGRQTDSILRALGYQPVFVYEKFRSEWTDGKGQVVVDHTPIGDFCEIEGKPRWIDTTANKLGVRREDYITKNYATLFADWKQETESKAGEMTFKAVRH